MMIERSARLNIQSDSTDGGFCSTSSELQIFYAALAGIRRVFIAIIKFERNLHCPALGPLTAYETKTYARVSNVDKINKSIQLC